MIDKTGAARRIEQLEAALQPFAEAWKERVSRTRSGSRHEEIPYVELPALEPEAFRFAAKVMIGWGADYGATKKKP